MTIPSNQITLMISVNVLEKKALVEKINHLFNSAIKKDIYDYIHSVDLSGTGNVKYRFKGNTDRETFNKLFTFLSICSKLISEKGILVKRQGHKVDGMNQEGSIEVSIDEYMGRNNLKPYESLIASTSIVRFAFPEGKDNFSNLSSFNYVRGRFRLCFKDDNHLQAFIKKQKSLNIIIQKNDTI